MKMAEVNLGNDTSIGVTIRDENRVTANVVRGQTVNTNLPDVNYIPAYKEAEAERRANEIVRQNNEAERQQYYEMIQEKVDNGEFDGEDGFSPIITTSKEGKETTITIIDVEGTKTATIFDGEEDKNFLFIQNEASDTWEITHNLNKYPSVSVIDSAGDSVAGEVKYDSLNKLTIYFKGGFKGQASLN